MARGLQFLAGCVASMSHLLAIGSYLSYMSQTDWLFGHHRGPPETILAAKRAAAVALVATFLWLMIALLRSSSRRASSAPPKKGGKLRLLPGVALVLLMVPATFIVQEGRESYPRANQEARAKHLFSQAATTVDLLDALSDSDPKIRWVATSVIESRAHQVRFGDPSQLEKEYRPALVAALVDALQDSNPETGGPAVMFGAAAALGALGPDADSALPALVEAVHRDFRDPDHDPDALRDAACHGLAHQGPSGIRALIKMLEDEDVHIRRSAARALGADFIDAALAGDALQHAQQDDDAEVRQLAGAVLKKIEANRRPRE